MTDAYSATDAAPVAPADDAAVGGKQPQEAVRYRVGTPLKNCGLCEHFDGVPGKAPDGCEVVDGTISPFGYCDIYLQQPNPFGDEHQYTMSGDQISKADTAAPPTSIGRKTYD